MDVALTGSHCGCSRQTHQIPCSYSFGPPNTYPSSLPSLPPSARLGRLQFLLISYCEIIYSLCPPSSSPCPWHYFWKCLWIQEILVLYLRETLNVFRNVTAGGGERGGKLQGEDRKYNPVIQYPYVDKFIWGFFPLVLLVLESTAVDF